MKSLLNLVKTTYICDESETKQKAIVEELYDNFAKTLTKEQSEMFTKFIAEKDKLENYKIKNSILTTFEVCKNAFKLR